MNPDDLREMWSQQPVDPLQEAELREVLASERAGRFMGAVGVLVALLMGLCAWWLPELRGPLLVLAGAVVWLVFAYGQWGSLPAPPPTLPLSEQTEYWRQQLLRQARWLAWAPLWGIAPLVMGMLLLLSQVEHPERVDFVLLGVMATLGSVTHWRAASQRRALAERLGQGVGG